MIVAGARDNVDRYKPHLNACTMHITAAEQNDLSERAMMRH